MSITSRRSLLATLAASAASVPLGALAAAPARAAGPVHAVEPFPVPSGPTSGRSTVTLPPLDASYFTQVTLGTPLTGWSTAPRCPTWAARHSSTARSRTRRSCTPSNASDTAGSGRPHHLVLPRLR
ncbi:hypothetical protein AB0O67_20240 [Streptomyces sp. NPDC086077]|uniref:hypothetical protein n=1 Tax=Streptomyces sp. NPDC086077 TaxID=3154862 RepID=UPI00342B3ABB